jgi:predicted AAA+ superfamily ATPase
LDLLSKAAVVHPVCRTAATGVPLGAEADATRFKALFLDIGLAEAVLGFDGGRWILDPGKTFVNAGGLAESFVGQELLSYGPAHLSAKLHYWHREARGSNAEVDYVIAAGEKVIPIEVKSGRTGQLKSMRLFLEARRDVAGHGIRFSTHNFSALPDLHSYPVYAVSSLATALDETVLEAVRSLT